MINLTWKKKSNEFKNQPNSAERKFVYAQSTKKYKHNESAG